MKIDSRQTQVNADFPKKISAFTCVSVRFCFFLCAFSLSALNIFAQSNLDFLAQKINRGSDEEKRSALAEIRNLQSPEAARLVVTALSDRSEIVRATAAQAVVFLPPEEATRNLLPLLQRDKSILVRKESAYALGKTRSSLAVRPLIETIQNDKIQEVRDAATVALGEIGDVSAVEALLRILQSRPLAEQEFFRRASARSIGQIAEFIQIGERRKITTPENFLPEKYKKSGDASAHIYQNLSASFPQFRGVVSVLISTLENQREAADTKREAAFALGAIADSTAIQILKTNLNNPDYYLAQICREALRKILPAETNVK